MGYSAVCSDSAQLDGWWEKWPCVSHSVRTQYLSQHPALPKSRWNRPQFVLGQSFKNLNLMHLQHICQSQKLLYQNTAAFVFVQWSFTITQNLFCIFFTGTTQFRNVKAKLVYMVVTWAMTRILTVCTISSSRLSSYCS